MKTMDMRRPRLWCLVVVLAIGLGGSSDAAGQSAAATPGAKDVAAAPSAKDATAPAASARTKLRVALAGSKPFVINSRPVQTGLSIDVWRAVADALGVLFEMKVYPSVNDAVSAVAAGEMDVAIGPISITRKRAEIIEFTQPYFSASAGILAETTGTSAWSRFKPVLSRTFLIGCSVLLLVLFLVGNLVWLAERRHNSEHFPRAWPQGVGTGMWFALVTGTTVGYGDRVPMSRIGRLITAVWMMIAILSMSSVTAAIATALTLSQIESGEISDLRDLDRRRVAAVAGTPGETLARRYRATVIRTKTKQEALDLVSKGEVEAMVYDYPVLQYYLYEHPELDLSVYESTVRSDNYGFVAARGSELVLKMDIALLELRESGRMEEIARQWLPRL